MVKIFKIDFLLFQYFFMTGNIEVGLVYADMLTQIHWLEVYVSPIE